jgi:hypothetical protein
MERLGPLAQWQSASGVQPRTKKANRACSLVAEHPVCIRKMGVRFPPGPQTTILLFGAGQVRRSPVQVRYGPQGRVAEWLKAAVLKTAIPERVS